MVTLCAQQGLGLLLVLFVRNYQLALTDEEAKSLTAHLPEMPRWLDLFLHFRLRRDMGKLSFANAGFLRDVSVLLNDSLRSLPLSFNVLGCAEGRHFERHDGRE